MLSLCLPLLTDGVFGRCQKFPAIDFHRYELSPGALQHLRGTWQKLSRTGFTWQDEYAQYVMAQELANLPRSYPRRPEASALARPTEPSADAKRRHSLQDGVALARALQHYLPYLGARSQASASSSHPRTELGSLPAEAADTFPESILTYAAHTPALTYPAGPRAQLPEALPLQTLNRPQPDQLSPQVDGSVDGHHLMAALSAYAARRPPVPPREGDLGPQYLLHVPPRLPRPLLAPATPQKWPSPPGDPKVTPGTEEGTAVPARGPGGTEAQVPAPNAPRPLPAAPPRGCPVFPGDAGRRHARVPLGTLVRSLLRDLRRQQADAASLRPLEPDETGGGTPGVGRDGRAQDGDDRVHPEVTRLSATLGDLLQDPGSQPLPDAPGLAEPFPAEMKKSAHPAAPVSSEEEDAGVENVRSQTYSRDLSERKPDLEPAAEGFGQLQSRTQGALWDDSLHAGAQQPPGDALQLQVKASGEEEEEYGYVVTDHDPLSPEKGRQLMEDLAHLLHLPAGALTYTGVLGPAVTFQVSTNAQNVTTADVAKATVDNKDKLEEASGLKILQSGVGSRSEVKLLPHQAEREDSTKFVVLTLVSVACIVGVLLASGLTYCLRHASHHKLKEKLSGLGGHPGTDATAAYQELCRQRMAVRPPDRPEGPHVSRVNSVSSQFSDGPMPSPSARSSTSSWSEEPVQPNMDISTGHMILAYMEDHLKNKNRLEKEWEALCAYQAEPSSSLVAQREENVPKNRSLAVLTYDHSRVQLKVESSLGSSDYINASPIMDHDPRNPAYIATQGPLPATVADFWQMVWESGCAVIVMLAPLTENGVRQCHHYWPDEGSNLYHVYEVNLVSEHIWCEDFLVRSFYLKNLQTNETRTVTQFHFLSWYDQGVPSSARSLLDFRRKVNKCYRGRSCPIIVHCSDGAGRSGTYILIDMVLNKMAKGAKEIDIAATLEHLRDQRPGMVQTKEQFEFALTAVAEEVNAILKALPQ
ncbi:PREDICTED: receptor-type tyrosine-protein phosphatase N2 [Propithecus coquereli]|uniref:receptor-type tyrosine-protein phosphatase N2 n=1 Tax=Propithecus coquereli TaxID=379532 RepID=UPI00063F0804|nr:PREDICTED: receptor-type tyrosine-protein phosphatase N2 [Propithecus coquereli]